jgi:macrolide-specific efflux system membrane fusion protein
MMQRTGWPLLLIAISTTTAAAQEVKVNGALVKLIDQLELPAREAGIVTELAVQEGAMVKAEDVLVRIDDTEARFALDRAKVELQIAIETAASDIAVRSADRALVTANAELKRAEDARLRLRDVVTDTEVEKLRLAADQAKLAVEKAQQERTVAQLQRDLKKVEADFAARNVARRQAVTPFAGVVVQVHKRPGDWVQPGDKLLRVIRLDRLRVEGFLDANHASAGLAGQPVSFLVDLPGRPNSSFRGKLIFVSPEIDPFNRSVRVLAEVENPGLSLQPGLKGTLVVGAR